MFTVFWILKCMKYFLQKQLENLTDPKLLNSSVYWYKDLMFLYNTVREN